MSDLTDLTPKKGNPPANWKDLFVSALASSGNISWSARRAKVTRQYVYQAREADLEFAAAWDDAIEQSSDAMEQAGWHRAVKGVKKTKSFYYEGERVGEDIITEYSDTLLMFFLKARRPEQYRERIDHSLHGPGGGPIRHTTEPDLSQLTDEELDLYEQLTAKLANA